MFAWKGALQREVTLQRNAQAFHNAPAIGFSRVVDQAKESAKEATTLGEVTFRLASLGGFQDPEALATSLTLVQAELVSKNGDAPFSLKASPRAHTETWYVGLWSYGRIYLSRSVPADDECELLGATYVPEVIAQVLARKQEEQPHSLSAGLVRRLVRVVMVETGK